MTAITYVNDISAGAINGGNLAIPYPAGIRPGLCSIVTVTLGTSKTTTLAVASSSGGAGFYTQIVTTIQSSNVRFGVFRRIITSSAEGGCLVTGSGGSTDSSGAALYLFSNVNRITPEDVAATSTSGSGTTPDSLSITVASCGTAIISAIGISVDLTPTAPTSFLNSVRGGAADTRQAAAAMAWITNGTTTAFNPTSWTSTTSVTWISATVALRREYEDGFNVGFDSAPDLVGEKRRTVVRSY